MYVHGSESDVVTSLAPYESLVAQSVPFAPFIQCYACLHGRQSTDQVTVKPGLLPVLCVVFPTFLPFLCLFSLVDCFDDKREDYQNGFPHTCIYEQFLKIILNHISRVKQDDKCCFSVFTRCASFFGVLCSFLFLLLNM